MSGQAGHRIYRKGYRFEHRVKKYLEKHGMYVVRSAKSHGVFDLVAVKNGVVYGIQCKYDGRIDKNTRNAMLELHKKHKIIPILAYSRNRKLMLVDLRYDKPISEI